MTVYVWINDLFLKLSLTSPGFKTFMRTLSLRLIMKDKYYRPCYYLTKLRLDQDSILGVVRLWGDCMAFPSD